MNLVDCNKLEVVPARTYGGATGEKVAVRYNGVVHMLKRQQRLKDKNFRNVELSYANDCVSEYIGSHVYSILGVPVHNTILGTYNDRLCVLCEDLAFPDKITEFRELRNSIMDMDLVQHSSGMSTSIKDILDVVTYAPYIDKEEVLSRFWLMFVVDSLIGNTDRNNGNWGFLRVDEKFTLCPVYDCGGCLNNKRSNDQILSDLNNKRVRELAINYTFNFKDDRGSRVNPFHYMVSNINVYLYNALSHVISIDMSKIDDLIYSLVPVISSNRAEYYYTIMDIRLGELKNIFETVKAKFADGNLLANMANEYIKSKIT